MASRHSLKQMLDRVILAMSTNLGILPRGVMEDLITVGTIPKIGSFSTSNHDKVKKYIRKYDDSTCNNYGLTRY